MGTVNRVFLMGNLTRDPEIRKTPSGTPVSDLGIAVSEKYKNKAGQLVETVCFADIVTWGRQAETCSQYLHKGSPVMVEGRLQLDQWKNDKGEKRSRLRVRADRIQFLSRGRGANAEDKPPQAEDRPAEEDEDARPAASMPF
ncbi:MAG: single-stranded DNA-binding protein [Verrucomicrobia bacterium]|nr:single-stranded DNA-binding protein [Verrucomicrobiota bacterium]